MATNEATEKKLMVGGAIITSVRNEAFTTLHVNICETQIDESYLRKADFWGPFTDMDQL